MIRTVHAAYGALLLASVLLSACERNAPAPPASAAAAAPKVLVRGLGPEPDSLDPQRARNFESATVQRDLFECLMSLDRSAAPVPGAAESWSASADGKTYTFVLRAGATWSNGDPVVAEDFVAGLRRLVDPATASQYAQVVDIIASASEIIAGRRPPEDLGVEAVDARTVRIRLINPAPYLLGLLTHPSTCPVHRATLSRHGSQFVRPGVLVGNGAFVLREWLQGAELILERNPRYWNAAATRLDRVRYVDTSDTETEYKRFQSGELHMTAVVPRAQFDAIQRDYPAELKIGPQLGTYFYGFSLDREPFRSKPGLRRALSLVIDRERLVRQVTRVGELPAYGWVPPGTHNYGAQRLDYADRPLAERIAEARRLYAAAGYNAARPLKATLLYNVADVHTRVALAITGMWQEALGAQITPEAREMKALQADIDARKAEIFRLAWIGDYNDAYTFAQYFKSDFGINLAKYASPEYDRLLGSAAAEADPAKRRALLEAAERVLLADHPVIPIYFYVNKHLVNRRVRGWYDNVMNVTYSKDLDLDEDAGDPPRPVQSARTGS
jgi:oligopeptide transport system substrate-binding protein